MMTYGAIVLGLLIGGLLGLPLVWRPKRVRLLDAPPAHWYRERYQQMLAIEAARAIVREHQRALGGGAQ